MSCQAKRSIRFFASAHEKTRKRLEKEKRPCRRRASDFHVGGVYLLHTHIHSIYISADGYIYVGKNCITSRCFGDTSRDERNPWQHPEGQTNKKETHKKNKIKSQMFSCWQTRRTSVCIDRLLCYQLMPSSRTRDEELLIELSTNHYYGTYKTSGVCQPLDSTETELLREREIEGGLRLNGTVRSTGQHWQVYIVQARWMKSANNYEFQNSYHYDVVHQIADSLPPRKIK